MRAVCLLALNALALSLISTACTRAQDAPRQDSPKSRTDSMTSDAGGYKTTRTGALSDSIVHLVGGDSVEWQSFGPLRITGKPDGMLVTYHPFVDLADTSRVRVIALSFFTALRPKFANGEPPYIVLRAVDLRAKERSGQVQLHAFGVVLEKRSDGLWYGLNEKSPLKQQD